MDRLARVVVGGQCPQINHQCTPLHRTLDRRSHDRTTGKVRKKLGSETAKDLHIVNVKLKNGLVLKNLAVRECAYITGRADDPNGVSDLDFDCDDIVDIRRTFWPRITP